MGMSPEERAAKKKRDKQRQKDNKNRATSIKPAGVVGSAISGSGSAKVRASKQRLPGMSATEQAIALSPQFDGMLGRASDNPALASPTSTGRNVRDRLGRTGVAFNGRTGRSPSSAAKFPDMDERTEFQCPQCQRVQHRNRQADSGLCKECAE